MKKVFAVLAVISALISLMSLSAFAAAPTKNEIYEVPVQLKHAEKDSQSMGDNYILHTALLEINDGTKYITMVSDSSASSHKMRQLLEKAVAA